MCSHTLIQPTRLLEDVFPTHLAEAAFANERVDLIAVHPLLTGLDDVVVVVVIITVIVQSSLLFMARVLTLRLLRASLLLRIVHLVKTRKRATVKIA